MADFNSTAPLEDDVEASPGQRDWLALTREAKGHSESFLNAYLRASWERSYDQFNSKHPSGSKYLANEYKGRSRLFRPKTRATVRRGEAAAAAAFFSTLDVVNISAVDDSDQIQLASAEVTNALLNYRLTKTIPWFLILMGGYQVAQIQGIVASKQYWSYRERKKKVPTVRQDEDESPLLDESGEPIVEDQEEVEVIEDQPVIKLLPPENLRVHEGSDWTDPVRTSPFIIEMIPMFAGEVRRRARERDPKTGQPEWDEPPTNFLSQAKIDATSGIRQKRSGYDPMNTTDAVEPVRDEEMVWVYEVIYKLDDEELHWYTLGEHFLLSDPRPLEEVYKHGRPYELGYGTLEALTVFPASKVAMVHDLQVAANDIENLRLDNIKLTLHPKTRVRAGVGISPESLISGAPGGVIFCKNPEDDIVYDRPPDVTRTAYEEQNYLNNDFDELAGMFSPASVQSNRELNDTVGGMAMLTNGMNALQEYDLRVFSETWVERVLRQLVKIEQAYETDITVLALAGKKANVWERYGLDPIIDDLLNAELTVTVNVGVGMTDPSQRVQKFLFAINNLFQIAGAVAQMYGPQAIQSPGFEAISKEVFGSVGYKDGKRFLEFGPAEQANEDPEKAQMMQYIQQLQQQLQEQQSAIAAKQIDRQTKLEVETMKGQQAQMKAGTEIQKAQMTIDADMLKTMIQAEVQRTNTLQEQQFQHAISQERNALDMQTRMQPQPMRGAA